MSIIIQLKRFLQNSLISTHFQELSFRVDTVKWFLAILNIKPYFFDVRKSFFVRLILLGVLAVVSPKMHSYRILFYDKISKKESTLPASKAILSKFRILLSLSMILL